MAFVLKDRVRETSTTTGTGALTLAGAYSNERAFSSVCSVGDTFWYSIIHSGTSWETGIGTYSGANTLARTKIIESSNSNAAVSFSAGTKDVFITLPASKVDTSFTVVADRTALAALTLPVSAILNEAGREGMFVWKAGDQSTHVTHDPGQGVYVAPASATSGASGAWMRVLDDSTKHLVTWFGAAANSFTDDATAIQRGINYLALEHLGGTLFFPAGRSCYIGSTLTLKEGVVIEGGNRWFTSITATGDFAAIHFDSTSQYAEIKNIFITGWPSTSATTAVVTVAAGRPVNFTKCQIWGGVYGVNTAGTDGLFHDCDIRCANPAGSPVISSGANWYERVKLDMDFAAHSAFRQTARAAGLTGVCENSFVDCDFSGALYTYSVYVDDGGEASALTKFAGGCVFSSPIGIINGVWSAFSTCEFGSTTLGSTAPISIVGSIAFAATTVTGGGAKSLAGNFNIS